MTLNLVLAASRAIHVGADFRLTNADTGALVTERSPKVLILREDDWEAVITYCGIGRWLKRDTSDWVREWVQHDPAVAHSFEETAYILEREGNSWLANIRRIGRYNGPHSFFLAGLVRGTSRLALVSNFDRLHGRTTSVASALSTEYVSPHACVIVSGVAQAVPRAAKKSLLASLKRGDDVNQIQRQIGRTIADAARTPAANKTISASGFSYSILPNGRGQGHLHGEIQGALEVISIVNGANPFALIRTLLGPNVRIVPTAHVSVERNRPIEVERCHPELEDSLDKEGLVSGFRIVELPDLGSGHARASSINSAGLVVGQSNRTPHGPSRACVWRDNGVLSEIGSGSLSSGAVDVSDNGQIAGTLQLADGGSRAFLLTDTGMLTSETLGGFHSNACALNNRGEVVGGSWSIPGNTQGDKRERAFKWTQGEGLQDLGALAEDWCSRAVDINDQGTIVGDSRPSGLFTGPNRAFIWTSLAGIVDLGSLDGHSSAIAINNRDEVIGLTGSEGRSVSFVWTRDRGMCVLALPEGSSVRAISNGGDIVYTRETPLGSRACISVGNREICLPCYRGHQSEAAAINDRGDIVGHVWRGNHGHAVKWIRVSRYLD
jgi:probable HAF family extracellular repeat protein